MNLLKIRDFRKACGLRHRFLKIDKKYILNLPNVITTFGCRFKSGINLDAKESIPLRGGSYK